jgi:site-specific DNA-methyltransferase (adenine-specific)
MDHLLCGDNMELMRSMPDSSVDLVFTSPPYEAARTYGIEFDLKGEAYVDWCLERYMECLRVSRGLVAWVIEGQTRQYRYTATPLLLMADLHRKGVHLRKPPAFARQGIPGSGGPDWLRNDYEFIICATKGGKLPWADNMACGEPCKYKTGGAMSNRTVDGQRRNAKTGKRLLGNNGRPEITNPGNIIKCNVGGGHLGSHLAHENEAPFPEKLAEFFIRSFCPPAGIVLDPFCGSGTVPAVAKKWGRCFVGIDIRESQIELTKRRLLEAA